MISTALTTVSVSWLDSPVMLPPGRARLATWPRLTGSACVANTMGIVLVARRAGSTSVEEEAKMTSTSRRTNSAASSDSWSAVSAHRKLNDNVLAFDIAEFAQAGPQRVEPASVDRGGTKPQEAEPRDLTRLLCLDRERSGQRTKRESAKERAPVHYTSARASPIRRMRTSVKDG